MAFIGCDFIFVYFTFSAFFLFFLFVVPWLKFFGFDIRKGGKKKKNQHVSTSENVSGMWPGDGWTKEGAACGTRCESVMSMEWLMRKRKSLLSHRDAMRNMPWTFRLDQGVRLDCRRETSLFKGISVKRQLKFIQCRHNYLPSIPSSIRNSLTQPICLHEQEKLFLFRKRWHRRK